MKINKLLNIKSKYNNLSFNSKKEDDTIKGVLLNKYIQKQCQSDTVDIDSVVDSLLIPQEIKKSNNKSQTEEYKESSFDYKEAFKPVAYLSAGVLGGFVGVSAILSKYSDKLLKNVQAPDLATNMNIMEEPHFAFYRMLIKPTKRNIIGFMGVCLFSGITLAAKNLIDGAGDIWIKKQECDIEQDYKRNMIQVEKDVFEGKLNVVNNMLKDNSQYFKKTLSNKKQNSFSKFINFQSKENKEENKEKFDNKNSKTLKFGLLGAAAIIGISFLVYKNYQKVAKNFDDYSKFCEDSEIKSNIEKIAKNKDKNIAIAQMTNLMKIINATQDKIEENFSKIEGITDDEIAAATKEILSSQIYSAPPEAFGGVANKIQYYCYINEERGHLYNWILHPNNPFNKYLFLGFSTISSIGYVAAKIADCIKQVAVKKENKNSELNMKKNLVSVEIENFKAKKECAVNPLVENFNLQLQNGKSKDELKKTAQNILIEIKEGPPYVYS